MTTPNGPIPLKRGRQLNVVVPQQLGQRLDAICFETGLSLREFSRYALTVALREAETHKEKFVAKVGKVRMELRAEERGFAQGD